MTRLPGARPAGRARPLATTGRRPPRPRTNADTGAEPRLDPEATWLDVAKVGRPHGVHGEVRLQPFNPATDVFERVTVLRALLPGRPAFPLQLEALRPISGGLVARFKGVADREAAAKLTHAVLSVDERDLPPLAEDEFYLHEVVGAEVFDAADGRRIGVVTGILVTNRDLLEIRLDGGGSALLPVEADAIESLGREKGKVVVRDIEDWRAE